MSLGIFRVTFYVEIKHSDWLLQVMRHILTNQSALWLGQLSNATLKFVYEVRSWPKNWTTVSVYNYLGTSYLSSFTVYVSAAIFQARQWGCFALRVSSRGSVRRCTWLGGYLVRMTNRPKASSETNWSFLWRYRKLRLICS